MIQVEMPGWCRWVLFTCALGAWWLGFFLVIGGLASYGGNSRIGDGGDLAAAIVGIGLFALGCGLGLLAFPTFTSITGAVLAGVAALSVLGLAAGALAVQKLKDASFDTDHATAALLIGAALCLLCAGFFTINWLIWVQRPGAAGSVRHVLHSAAIGWGSLLFLGGLTAAFSAVVAMVQARGLSGADGDHLAQAVYLSGVSAIALGAGAVLVWHGAAALAGVPSGGFRLPPFWKLALAAIAAIGAGAALLQTETAVGLMPLAHAGAVVLPGLTIIALVDDAGRRGRSEARSSWREVLLMVAYGAAVAATIAGIVNSALLVFEFISAADVVNRRLVDELSHGTLLVLLLIGISVLVPLDEEFCKGFGVRLLRDHRPTRCQAFLWGLASGVGFGAVEASEYGFGAFHQSPYRWWDAVLLRGAASSLHALASGIVGIAWFYMFQGKRWRFAGCYLMAVGLHGSWNALNLLTVARVAPGFKRISNHDLEIGLEVVLGLVAIGILALLWALARRLAREHDDASAEPPYSSPLLETLTPLTRIV